MSQLVLSALPLPPEPFRSLAPALPAAAFALLVVFHDLGISPSLPSVLQPFLTVDDLADSERFTGELIPTPAWKRILLLGGGILEMCYWGYALGLEVIDAQDPASAACAALLLAAWTYFALRIVLKAPTTAPYALMAFYAMQTTVAAVIVLQTLLLPVTITILAPLLAQLAVPFTLFLVSLSFPFQLHKSTGNPEIEAREDFANVAQWTTFTWVAPLIAIGRARKLEESDISPLSPFLRTETVSRKYRELRRPALITTLVVTNALDLLVYICLCFVSSLLGYVSPYLLGQILTAVSKPTSESVRRALVLATLAFCTNLLRAQTDLHNLVHSRRAATRCRSALISEIYRKALIRRDLSGGIRDGVASVGEKVEEVEEAGADVGKVVNLMSSDASSVANQLLMLGFIVTAPFELTIAIFFLYSLLGWSAAAGIVVVIVALPFNYILTKFEISVEKGMRKAKDSRVSVVTELIEACRTLKYFAWEGVWLEKAFSAREVELSWLLKDRLIGLMMGLLWTLVPDSITLLTFLTFTKLAHRDLTVPIAFVAVAVFNQVRAPLTYLPNGIMGVLQTYVSIKRIEKYLAEPDVPEWVSSLERVDHNPTHRIAFEDASFQWASISAADAKGLAADAIAVSPPATGAATPQQVFELKNVTAEFPIGEISLITGATGSGKTATLYALLGEMNLVSGGVHLPKSLQVDTSMGLYNGTAFAAQQPWLEHASIKDNILFASPFDQERYDAVVEACALTADFGVLEDGDATEIGEKGVSLSGGQKARVALARAVYSRARHVLADDPLSAVDAHTAKHLYEKLFLGPLMKGRTLVLVTHNVELCRPAAKYVVQLSEGTLSDITAASLEALEATTPSLGSDDGDTAVDSGSSDTVTPPSEPVEAKVKSKARKMIEDEARAEGSVKWTVYRTYLDEVGYVLWACLLVLMGLERVAPVGQQFWLREWGESYKESVVAGLYTRATRVSLSGTGSGAPFGTSSIFPPASDNVDPYLWVYFGIGVAYALISIVTQLVSIVSTLKAARALFRKALSRVVRAPSRWFDTTPVGRILNRLGSDMETVDWRLNMSVTQTIESGFGLISAFAVVLVLIPWFLLPAIGILCIYGYLSYAYVRCSRDIRRLMANARSPIFAKFSETLHGVVTIRAFSAEQRFLQTLYGRCDKFAKQDWSFWMINRYLLLRFDALGAVAVYGTTIVAVASGASAGTAALAIVSAQSLVLNIYWMCRFYSALEVDLNAIERLSELLQTDQEPPAVLEYNRPPAIWPSTKGGIEVSKLEIKYSPELPPVVKGISLSILPGQKIGICGRTGSGKSTFAMSLLRFVDPSEGQIVIDGIDISTIGLEDLRSKITIIPQEAVLFSGTVRSNLDPFSLHSDEELWDVLDRVRLSEATQRSSGAAIPARVGSTLDGALPAVEDGVSTPTSSGRISISTLSAAVAQGGHNFSQGQRQLLALARAMLRRSNVIIMDEATASVDFETDAIIQTTIAEQFADCIVLTIAHRLRTVIDYDMILVLEQGVVAEFDTPRNLLLDENSTFGGMCRSNAGEWEAIKLQVGI